MQFWPTMKTSKSRLGVLLMLSTFAACATAPPRAPAPGQDAIAIRRGATWATYSLALPRIIGPTAELKLKDGVLSGFMGGAAMNVTIRGNEASGFGPGGSVNLTLSDRDDGVAVDGMWNDGPVHLVWEPSLLRGSVVVRHGRRVGQETSCGYQLDRIDPSGALTGSSTCAGMPQQTRLEMDAGITKRLTRPELAVLLVAALASPPLAQHEWR
jgi:hypothetical protein